MTEPLEQKPTVGSPIWVEIKDMQGHAWQAIASFRWRQSAGTTTAHPTLEQLWLCRETGKQDWRPIPVEYV